MTTPSQPPRAGKEVSNAVADSYFEHSNAPRISTDAVMLDSIQKAHPGVNVTIVPEGACNLLAYAAEGHATARKQDISNEHFPTSLKWLIYTPPAKKLDGDTGALVEKVFFEKYVYQWKNLEFLVYLISGRDGGAYYPEIRNQYILGSKAAIQTLVLTVGRFESMLHNEIWVFEMGIWHKDADLYQNIMKASWDNVILDASMKNNLIHTIDRFFTSREEYDKLSVPWKRGLLFYGPPGNGKTVSIKATMNRLYTHHKPGIPTLYVKTLANVFGPEYAINSIFLRARADAPCFLVFEDLDSMISDQVRSFFLNAVDGLSANDGILMLGSTNHLDRLDPGIAKRPSRFDRKYLFPDPNLDQRTEYVKFWQRKLKDNKDIEFPDVMCPAIARITHDFSFAYIQEAFVSTLVKIASDRDEDSKLGEAEDAWSDVLEELSLEETVHVGEDGDGDDKDLDKYLLWREIKAQVKVLRTELGKEKTDGLF